MRAPAGRGRAAAARPASHVARAEEGEALLRAGEAARAAEVFAAVLADMGGGPGYERAVILERLGRCLLMRGRAEALGPLREAMAIVAALPAGGAARALLGVLRADEGDFLGAAGRYPEARAAYREALAIAEASGDLRAQGVDRGQLGALALREGKTEEAIGHYSSALALFRQSRDADLEATICHQLGTLLRAQGQAEAAECHLAEALRGHEARGHWGAAGEACRQLAALAEESGRIEAAEARQRKAVAHLRRAGEPGALGRALHGLAGFLLRHGDRPTEARQPAEEALLSLQQGGSPDAWKAYGLLAEILEREAGGAAEAPLQAALGARAVACREVAVRAPPIFAALARLHGGPGCGRAMLLGRLGRCFLVGGRPDLAVAPLREAAAMAAQQPFDDDAGALLGSLHADLARALEAAGRHEEARRAQEISLSCLAASACEAQPADGKASGATLTLREELATDWVFEPDLLLDGRRAQRTVAWNGKPQPLPDGLRPVLAPGTRTWVDADGAVRFLLDPGEPGIERRADCVLLRHTRREVAVAGQADILWKLVRAMDGTRDIARILAGFPAEEAAPARALLDALAATGVVDASGRAWGRWLHGATRKGALPGGGLAGDEVLRLATDGDYRAYPGAPRLEVAQATPARLEAFHRLTRQRRSRRDYRGQAIGREEFDALLHTACGVTGVLAWAGQETKLRAYPASGALYAVEVYAVALRVQDLPPGVYHYRAVDSVLETVRGDIDPRSIVSAALPVERDMVAGAAALLCLAGCFPRHEKKYGEGGYRMLVAEAGHISQNLVLAATALGLSARPFGGVFDALLNQELGFEGEEEQFLLGVLVGHAAGSGHS